MAHRSVHLDFADHEYEQPVFALDPIQQALFVREMMSQFPELFGFSESKPN